ncbi:hypothetical protein Anapl_11975 [Anas platyrhynchos]|uniref:Uncharacterized protein n=1 Tax=Anas platyrhynchos TaxID=8839 RepID=R0L195_ANAPL|nr:hypothetical protein Anapl_11975 [Anas platyrhynchos]
MEAKGSRPQAGIYFLFPLHISPHGQGEKEGSVLCVPGALQEEQGYNTTSGRLHNATLPASARGDLHGEPRNFLVPIGAEAMENLLHSHAGCFGGRSHLQPSIGICDGKLLHSTSVTGLLAAVTWPGGFSSLHQRFSSQG